jgi:hypothetical protein
MLSRLPLLLAWILLAEAGPGAVPGAASLALAPRSVVVALPGMDPAWWARYGDPQRDRMLERLLGGEALRDAAQRRRALEAAAGAVLAQQPDSVLAGLLQVVGDGPGLIRCGVGPEPEGTVRLWLSPALREIASLEQGLPPGPLVRPAAVRSELARVGGVGRPLRTEEVEEILALDRRSLEAFRNLPGDLPDHPMARLKRVFLGDKLLANATLYAMAQGGWDWAFLRLGLAEAWRGAVAELAAAGAGADLLKGMEASGSLVADRLDRILNSLWHEIPSGGRLYLLLGSRDSTWVLVSER